MADLESNAGIGACAICGASTLPFKNGKPRKRCARHVHDGGAQRTRTTESRRGADRKYRLSHPERTREYWRRGHAKRRDAGKVRIEKAKRRARLKAAGVSSRSGKPYVNAPPGDRLDRMQTALSRKNATQAWQYWLTVRANTAWLAVYWKAHPQPWKDSRLSDADQYRLRYRTDEAFAARERARSTRARFMKPERAAMWKNHGDRWWRATHSADGSVDAQLMKALQQETHCAYCLQPLAGDMHIDHVMPLARGGAHSADNLVAACARCNRAKAARAPLAFMLSAIHRPAKLSFEVASRGCCRSRFSPRFNRAHG